MEEVRLLLREDGREARNILAFHVAVDDGKLYRKPPCPPRTPEPRRSLKRTVNSQPTRVGSHVRSVSTGRDKRSELRARYWALLFGNLQRAVGEIYNTVETHESLVECQETILVMENYIRDFRSLAEWFRLKWDYENTPAPQRPTSLAWEVRKASLPSPSHSERVSPSPPLKLGRTSPQNKQTDRLIIKDPPTTLLDPPLLPISPQPEPILEVDEKPRDVDAKLISKIKNHETTENILSPSEDQKTYINVIKKASVSSAEVGTSTDEFGSPRRLLRKAAVLKVSQASQTDEEANEKTVTSTTISTTMAPVKAAVKSEIKPMRSAPITASRAAYATALSKSAKPQAKTSPVRGSKPNSVNTMINNKFILSTIVSKTSPMKNIPTVRSTRSEQIKTANLGSRFLRSKTSGEIKSPTANTSSMSFMKQRSSIGMRNSTAPKVTSVNKVLPNANRNTLSRRTSLVSATTKSKQESKPITLNKTVNSERKESDKESISSSAETIVNTRELHKNDLDQKLNKSNPKLVNGVVADGWLTVKCRSRFKSTGKPERKVSSHWSNRFNEVSATTSLPALALLQDSDSETMDEKENTKKGFNGSESERKPPTYLKRTNTVLTKSPLKSDVRRTENYRNHKAKSVEPAFLNYKSWTTEKAAKLIKHVEREPKSSESETSPPNLKPFCTNQKIHDTIHKSDSLALKRSAVDAEQADDEMDKFESQDEEEHCRKTRQLTEEEAMLTQEIAELQSSAMDIDTETDGTETDGEAGDDEEDALPLTQDDDLSLEARYEPVLAGLSWGERMDTLAALEDLVARHPGRAMQLHQKLSNPSRRRSLPETLRRYQAKHARAQQRRQALQQERAVRLQALLARVQDVKSAKLQLIEDKRMRMENRLHRAELNRTQHLKSVVRKAHDEEEKLREIAFIKELEAQNKRHDFLELCREQKGRLKDLREGQRKKIEEQAARGAAVEERRRALEQARHDRLERLQAERRLRAERVGLRQLEIQEQAREKARGREERISALHAQQLASTRELQKRISQKQEESARRHEENIEQIRQKALELSILRSHNDEPHTPALTPYELQKLCTVCNVHISSEVYLLSHLRGRSHQEAVCLATGPLVGDQLEQYELAHIIDAPVEENHPRLVAARERVKTLRKRCKKIRQRMASKGAEFETEYKPPQVENASKRSLSKGVHKVTTLMGQGWVTSACTQLDRILGDTNRLLMKNQTNDLLAFQTVGWFGALSKLLTLGLDVSACPPVRSLITACNLWRVACKQGSIGADNCKYSVLSNRIIVVLDLLNARLQGLAKEDRLPAEPLATAAMQLLATVLKNVPDQIPAFRIQDVVSYAVCVGVVEQLAQCCVSVRGPVHDDAAACGFLLAALDLLTGLARRCGPPPPLDQSRAASVAAGAGGACNGGTNHASSSPSPVRLDPTHFTAALHSTELVGAVSMLYGTLLPTGASPRCEGKPHTALPTPCLALATSVCRLLRQVAELDLHRFQQALGAEGVSLQFRHIAGHLLWSCATPPSGSGDAENATQELLHEVIAVVGYFAIGNNDNQMLLVSGYAPSVLQQLCTLPFAYFSVPKLSAILYPTLLACCYDNPHTTQMLQQELSYELLNDFRKSNDGSTHPLVKLLGRNSGEDKKSEKLLVVGQNCAVK